MRRSIGFISIICCCSLLFFSCQKEFSNETNTAQIAAGSLSDSTGNCISDSVAGTFYGGVTPGADTAFVEVAVNVTQVGTYSISTNLQNGFEFADSGVFTQTGLNTIRLKPIGTPIIPTSTSFIVSFDSSFCSFTVNVKDSTGLGLGSDTTGTGDPDSGNQWQFTTADGTFSGTFDTATIATDTVIWRTGRKMLYLQGFTKSSTDTALTLIMYLQTGSIPQLTTQFNTQAVPQGTAAIFGFNLTQTGNAIYYAIPDNSSLSDIIITITSYNPISGVVTGTISGKANDTNGDADVDVSNGSFTATVH